MRSNFAIRAGMSRESWSSCAIIIWRCASDHHEAPSPWEVTARHVYVRGHGPTGRYRDRYPKATLERWAKAIALWRRKRLTIFCYFDNDQKTAAPRDAQQLIDLSR